MKRFSKRVICILVAASLEAGCLAGCGEKQKNEVIMEETQSDTVEEAQSETVEETHSDTVDEAQSETVEETHSDTVEETQSDIEAESTQEVTDEFYLGMDASSLLAEENSGVKYYDFDGQEADPLKTMADSGINYLRLRVWNDPYDENGNGYGGGNNDVPTAIELGKRATGYGMKVCIDFHYSDFWADPKRQHSPKAWEGMNAEEKAEALYTYTVESLTQILDAGVDVGMVQIGNEINNGMSGVALLPSVMKLLSAGSKAVREVSKTYDKDIEVVIHYTNIDNAGEIDSKVSNLKNAGIDYDILGLSYYPFWDGSFENMQSVIRHVKEAYEKKVMIAETSYCYTTEDGDGFSNSFDGVKDLVEGYPATVQGQADMVRDTVIAANEAGAEGVFYWEGAWIPVGPAGEDNSEIWEKYGSGWASSYASDYDPEDAGLYYGGCSWENQAFFDFDGKPLESLKVYSDLQAELSKD